MIPVTKNNRTTNLLSLFRDLTFQETRPPAKGWSHLKMLMQINKIYYDWNTDGLSTDWLGLEREKKGIYRNIFMLRERNNWVYLTLYVYEVQICK